MNDYNIYMQELKPDNSLGVKKDLEADFDGLVYLKCVGLEDFGKPHIFTEKYSDSDELRVHIPNEITRDATKITLTLAFKGINRRASYRLFYEFVKKGKFKFWDTIRKKEALLVLTEAVSPSDDILIGSEPYIEVPFIFQNLYGQTKTLNILNI